MALAGTAGLLGARPLFANVKDPVYGAKGDGVTDDTAAIQAALTAVSGRGAQVDFPAGTYVYTIPLVLDSPKGTEFRGIRIKGHGQVTLQFNGKGVALTLKATRTNVQNIMLEDLLIRGNPNCTDVLYMVDVEKSVFRNLRLEECTGQGLQVDNGILNLYENITVSGNGIGVMKTRPVNGILLENQTTACTFINPMIEGVSGAGIRIIGGSGSNVFIGGTVESGGASYKGTHGVTIAAECDRNKFVNLFMEDNSTKDVDDAGNATVWDNCTFASYNSSSTYGLHITGGEGQVVIGGLSEYVKIDAGAVNVTVIGLQFNRLTKTGTFVNSSNSTRVLGVNNYTTNALSNEAGFTVTDTSGAKLTITTNAAIWEKIGRNYTCKFKITFPVTASGAGNSLGGLPAACGAGGFDGGFISFTNYTATQGLHVSMNASSATFRIYDGDALLTNAQCSGKTFAGTIIFRE